MIEAVRDAMREEMRRDERVFVMGEDIGARGGVFLATDGFLEEFGEERVIDTPLAESSIAGIVLGAAINGMRPIAEIEFADFIWPGYDQIVSELAKYRYRSGGHFTAPVVIRTPYGGGIRGGQAVGSTNRLGEVPQDRPLRPGDIHHTIFKVLGVDPNVSFENHGGRPIPAIDHGSVISELI